MAVSRTKPRPAAAETRPREVRGIARLGKRTKHLVKRLRRGDIAILDHTDLDRVSAEDLIACGVEAVINTAPSSTGRYPNAGPLLLVQAGIVLVDAPGAPLFSELADGDTIEIHGGEIRRNGDVIARGEVQDPATVQALNDERRRDIGEALEAFAHNTVEHMVAERELLSGKLELPQFATEFRDRPCLVVVRGVDHKRDIKALRPYIRDVKPVLIGVDGGADALIEEGFKPHMIVGDMDSATEPTLRCGAELVVHAYSDGRAPGREHLGSPRAPLQDRARSGHEPGRRHADRPREVGGADRVRGLPLQPRRVPRQEPPGDVLHLPHAPADRRDPRRREGREPAVPAPAGRGAAAARARAPAWSHARRADVDASRRCTTCSICCG